ncbi:MAG: hypothetical protein ABIJ28_00010 [Patescibacteria group bacterium]
MKKLVFVGTITDNGGLKNIVFWFFPEPRNDLIKIKDKKIFVFKFYDPIKLRVVDTSPRDIERAKNNLGKDGELVALIGQKLGGTNGLFRLWIRKNILIIHGETKYLPEIKRKTRRVLIEIFGDIFEFKNVPHEELHSMICVG